MQKLSQNWQKLDWDLIRKILIQFRDDPCSLPEIEGYEVPEVEYQGYLMVAELGIAKAPHSRGNRGGHPHASLRHMRLTEYGELLADAAPDNTLWEKEMGYRCSALRGKSIENNFNGPIGSAFNEGTQYNIAAENYGSQTVCQHPATLEEISQTLRELLDRFLEEDPQISEAKLALALDRKVTPDLKARFASALQAGWKEVIEKVFEDSIYASVAIAALEG